MENYIPTDPIAPELIAERLDVFTVEPTLGTTDRIINTGVISVGKPEIGSLSSLGPSPDVTHDHYLVKLWFTLHPPLAGTGYQEVIFKIALASGDFIARDLVPASVYASEEVERSFEISPDIQFNEVSAKLGSLKNVVKFERLRAIISASGKGESEFYWTLKGHNGEPVVPETKGAFVVLQTPRGTHVVAGTVSYELTMRYSFMGGVRERPVRTRVAPFQWVLPHS